MKAIIFVAVALLCVVSSAPLRAYEENKQIKFDYDVYGDSPIGLYVSGLIDPRNENLNKIQTFIKLANQYIPVLESIANANQELKWERRWNVNVMGFNVDVYAYFQLYVGWRVNPGGYTTDRFDVTYTPFVWGMTYGNLNGTSFPAVGQTSFGLQYAYAYAPISVQLYKAGKICFQGSYVVEPVNLRNHLFAALNECRDEILDDLINGGKIFDWACNYTNPVNITIWDKNFTNRMAGDFIGQTCFNF
uniref:Uncharacterized protein n=1 Tax=Euplotes harpa TaxID=151035 RepID=A0A7S3NFQ6_9SPIT|mmetsp:Transcript_6404/g.7360  ORF Transcript_6404/g.7360 Transcript_6404/m.7360 type:complete len:247 (+) Transcript_6404:42-782(+)|eukprot:CAMPEP_0168329738 /NCGR_PEP_ID=MMETSP0213-20121227/7290_1 /TAXON_ID=151035 /ORGANISM="Euplotes harpa, Strain FSP1.4" /LENGTH=246 /DNA_ID=CAMNT_0008333127 /DNA_START=251 /DNA_END=991 /DNA_ORIENTATION=+